MIETLPDSAPVFHSVNIMWMLLGSDLFDPTIDGRCSEGVSRAGSRGRVLNFYDDTEQGGKEPRCQEGDQAEATRKIDKNRAFHIYDWLVVWNMAVFFHFIYGIILPID